MLIEPLIKYPLAQASLIFLQWFPLPKHSATVATLQRTAIRVQLQVLRTAS